MFCFGITCYELGDMMKAGKRATRSNNNNSIERI
jgi:hypothetical protein